MARKREFDKDTVLEQAMLLFWEQGYEATSMRALQKAMGISSSSMYETFGDKRSIFLAALQRYCEIERLQVVRMAEASSDVSEFVQNLFLSIEQILPDTSQNFGSMTFNTMAEFGMRDKDVTDLLYSHFIAIADMIAKVLEQAQTTDAITTQQNPTQLAHFILSTLQGLATIKSMKPNYPYANTFQQLIVEILNA